MKSTLDNIITTYGMDKLDSLTKYPSILTYHALHSGGVTNKLTDDVGFPENSVLEITEKIDGSNSRLVMLGDDYIIGTRDAFVYAKNDRIINSEIIEPVKSGLCSFIKQFCDPNSLTIVFGETYGYGIQEYKQYIENSKHRSFRVFDIVQIPITHAYSLLETKNINQIVSWREKTNPYYLSTEQLSNLCSKYDMVRTPILKQCSSTTIPVDVVETYDFLKSFSKSMAMIDPQDPTFDKKSQSYGRSEGIVIRTKDRSFIRKLRFADYSKGERQHFE